MILRDTCYFCGTPFHFFSILALAMERKETADLYIYLQFSKASEFAERINKLNIFSNIKVIDTLEIRSKYLSARGGGLKNHVQIANTYLHVDDIAEKIMLPNVRYKNIFVFSRHILPRLVRFSYIRRKWEFELCYFDDGVSSYYKNGVVRSRKTDIFLRKLLFGRKAVDENNKLYLLAPEIYKQLNADTDYRIERIDRFWETEIGRNILNDVFNTSSETIIKEKLIILDLPKDEVLNPSDIESIEKIYRSFVEKVGLDDAIIKKHPRSTDKNLEGIQYFKDTGVPFEIYCMNMNMDEKVLVGYFSTALVMPKVLFNQEPRVIVLARLFQPRNRDISELNEYFDAVKKSYTNPERFCVPESIEELREILHSL